MNPILRTKTTTTRTPRTTILMGFDTIEINLVFVIVDVVIVTGVVSVVGVVVIVVLEMSIMTLLMAVKLVWSMTVKPREISCNTCQY